jgi:hypothetical protein
MRRDFPWLASICVLFWLVAGRGLTNARADEKGAYYVDCGAAEKSGDGRSPETAWRTLDTVNGHVFAPGDVIYLKRGTECRGLLWPKGSGSASAGIRLTAYGSGARPKVIAGKNDEEAFKLFNQEYWDVDSIDFAGGTVFGVFVSGDAGILHHIHLRNLVVHDVHGGDVKHKESGLVVVSPGKVQQHFDDVLIDGITAYRTEQWAGILVGGGNFGEVAEENWSTRVVVRNSVVHDVYGDGIILFRVKDGLIDTTAAWRTGMQPTQSIGTPNAIWTWMCKDCVVKDSEAFLTDSPGVDGGAFDIDYGNTRNSVLDSYAHDTQGYCIAVFGAGYVTRESVVKGNLCVNNARSPRMARLQGAIFIYTWNGGVIENLSVESNYVYWAPPGNFPAVVNRADIRGAQRIFRGNRIYSSAPWMIESNKEIALQDNRYTTCGSNASAWLFDGKLYTSFDEFRAGSGEDKGSSWSFNRDAAPCLGGERSNSEQNSAGTRGKASTGWTIVSEIPASIDAQGLLDAAAAGQLMVLKNLYLQYRASGLRMKITLYLKHPGAGDSTQNLIRDLGMSGIQTAEPPGQNSLTKPRTHLVAPDGSTAKDWRDFAGPAEIGLAARSALGEPLYSQMEPEDGE